MAALGRVLADARVQATSTGMQPPEDVEVTALGGVGTDAVVPWTTVGP